MGIKSTKNSSALARRILFLSILPPFLSVFSGTFRTLPGGCARVRYHPDLLRAS